MCKIKYLKFNNTYSEQEYTDMINNIVISFSYYNNIIELDLTWYRRLFEPNGRLTKLTKLPELPNSLIKLSCGYNQLSVLPKLPNSLRELNCEWNQLSVLPELPNSLNKLCYNSNKFINKHKYKYLSNIIY